MSVVTDPATVVVASIRERRNWLIHLLYVRQEVPECLSVIEEQLRESKGLCEYALFVKGLIRRTQGELNESLALFQAAAMISPQRLENLKQIGRALYLLGKHKAAIEMYEEAAAYDDDWEIFHSMGLCHVYLQQLGKAVDAFLKANAVQRHDATFLQLGKVYTMKKQYEQAVETYIEALEFSPEHPELLTTLGLLYLRIGESTRAFNYLSISLTVNPRDPRTILAAGSIMQDDGDYEAALTQYRISAAASVASTSNSPHLWNNIGMAFFGKNNFIPAVSCLRRALFLAPLEWAIAYNLGVVFLHAKQYVSALDHFSAAINNNPNFAASHVFLGVALSHLNDVERACASFERGIALRLAGGAREEILVEKNGNNGATGQQQQGQGQQQPSEAGEGGSNPPTSSSSALLINEKGTGRLYMFYLNYAAALVRAGRFVEARVQKANVEQAFTSLTQQEQQGDDQQELMMAVQVASEVDQRIAAAGVTVTQTPSQAANAKPTAPAAAGANR